MTDTVPSRGAVTRNVRWYEKRYAKGYKLLRVGFGPAPKLSSAMECSAQLAYRVGGWTHQPNGWGPLGVFESLEATLSFVSRYRGDFVVAECYYEPSPYDTFWSLISSYDLLPPDTRHYYEGAPPRGTQFADRVMLTRLLPGHELDEYVHASPKVNDTGAYLEVFREVRDPRWSWVFDGYRRWGGPVDWHDPRTLAPQENAIDKER